MKDRISKMIDSLYVFFRERHRRRELFCQILVYLCRYGDAIPAVSDRITDLVTAGTNFFKTMSILKHILAFLPSLLVSVGIQAQQVSWKASSAPAGEGVCTITLTAEIPDGWHIYDFGPYEGGPNPTVITCSLPGGASFEGDIVPSVPPVRYDDAMFGMEIGYWEKEVTFTWMVRCGHSAGSARITVEWMACNDSNCVPPDEVEFEVVLVPGAAPAVSASSADTIVESGSADSDARIAAGETSGDVQEKGDASIWGMILAAVLWGLAALLTPCVFPIIPMTVSFFMKGDYSASRNRFRALMYGLFIVLLYTVPIAVIILLTRVIGGDAVTADIFNWIATHWLPNILFFLIFMAFAASFFGAFEIVLPSRLQNDSDAQVDKKKGLGGVFFLALTLVLVSFSCTGPIVGTVLIKSVSGEFWVPMVTMLAFSVAFSLPFVIFAMFPGMMKKLPRSGGWLNTVKVVLGFVELALGLKFLSTADQVYHWGILDREVYLAVWITVFTLLGFYLLGKLKFKYDSEVKYIGVGRLVLAIIDFTFVVYMIPGMWGAPLKALSGYLPPMETQDFVIGENVSPSVAGTASESISGDLEPGHGRYSEFLELPLGLRGFFDLDEALAYGARTGKPVFIDFTGHGCVNCREMESRVWSDERVLAVLRDDFVICALYTDDKLTVDSSDWVTTDKGKVLKTLGKINSHYAQTVFGVAAQPFYVLMTPDGTVVRTMGYALDVEAFLEFLKI